jgi:hypothetical protein
MKCPAGCTFNHSTAYFKTPSSKAVINGTPGVIAISGTGGRVRAVLVNSANPGNLRLGGHSNLLHIQQKNSLRLRYPVPTLTIVQICSCTVKASLRFADVPAPWPVTGDWYNGCHQTDHSRTARTQMLQYHSLWCLPQSAACLIEGSLPCYLLIRYHLVSFLDSTSD